MANHTTRTPAKAAQFLEALAETGNISAAAKQAGIPRQTLYDWRDADPEFARGWQRAHEIGLDSLQDEAIRRACEGMNVGVYQGGIRIGTERKYSDLLLMFLLRSRSEKDQASHELVGKIIDAKLSPAKMISSFSEEKEAKRL